MVRLISLIMIIIFSGTNTHAKELDLGSKMPLVKTKMMDISGKSISLSEAKGENVIHAPGLNDGKIDMLN